MLDESDSVDMQSVAGNEFKQRLQAIDRSITGRHIHGKFQGRVVLHGQEVLPEGYNSAKAEDYTLVPAVPYSQLDPTSQFQALNEFVRKAVHNSGGSSDLQRQLAVSHTLSYYPDPVSSAISYLQLIYPYEFTDRAGRPGLTVQVFFDLPTSQIEQLVSLARSNPDTVESFYQIATNGLDKAIQRRGSNQLAIVDLNTFMPLDKFRSPNPTSPTPLHQIVDAYPNRLNPQGLTLLHYSQPFGSRT